MTIAPNRAPKPQAGGEYRIGRYRVRARLGKGGMGVVYLGRDEALDRDVAIKTLRVEGSQDDESRGRFQIEAKASARLQHPNIVTVFELGEDRGLPFIAMELLGGQDLETLLRSGERLSNGERLDIVAQTLRGLDFAHGNHIIHRDIKPSNLRVLDDGGVKILDFGIAKVESNSVTRAGMMVGTPHYMSPEHIRGGVLDGRSDVFAVGVILHQLFAGVRPFVAEDPTRVLFRIVNDPQTRLPKNVAGAVTEDLQKIIDKALEKHVDDRFDSAAQMADELTRLRERYPTPHLSPRDIATLSQARKSLAADPMDQSMLGSVEAIALANPEATEAHRLVRLFKRKPADTLAMAETKSFPELDATFGRATTPADQTMAPERTLSGSASTVRRKSPLSPPASTLAPALPISKAPPSRSNALLYVALAACVLTGSTALILYLNRPEPPAAPSKPTPQIVERVPRAADPVAPTPVAEASSVPAAVATKVALKVTSQPPGATVRLDKKVVGVTPLSLQVTSSSAHAMSLSLAGYQSKDVRLELPLPGSVNETLTPDAPPARLVVESAYPVTVSTSGRAMAADKSGFAVTLPAGSHDVAIESAAVFLKHRETVQLKAGGAFTIRIPPSGSFGVRANPDNCKVLVDGVFVDYPPIIDRAIASGSHTLSFEWPDGARSEQKIQIQPGQRAYFNGRKP